MLIFIEKQETVRTVRFKNFPNRLFKKLGKFLANWESFCQIGKVFSKLGKFMRGKFLNLTVSLF